VRRLFLLLPIGLIVIGSLLTFSLIKAYALDENKRLDENNCLLCHGDPELTETDESGNEISLYVSRETIDTAAHLDINCTTCHIPQKTVPHEVAAPLTKLSSAKKCGFCHQPEYKLHLESIHGQQLVQGNPDVATCVDCHSPEGNPHNVIQVPECNSPVCKKNIAETCAKCHADEELMASYGLVEKVYETYMRSFHGKAMQLGSYETGEVTPAVR